MKTRPPKNEVNIKAVRSRGPGGQHVNKVASAAILYWDIAASPSFTPQEKDRIFRKLTNTINTDGLLHLRSDEARDLLQNKEIVYDKLVRLVRKALFIPKPRKKTKPSRAQKEKRLKSKSKRSETKAARQKVRLSD